MMITLRRCGAAIAVAGVLGASLGIAPAEEKKEKDKPRERSSENQSGKKPRESREDENKRRPDQPEHKPAPAPGAKPSEQPAIKKEEPRREDENSRRPEQPERKPAPGTKPSEQPAVKQPASPDKKEEPRREGENRRRPEQPERKPAPEEPAPGVKPGEQPTMPKPIPPAGAPKVNPENRDRDGETPRRGNDDGDDKKAMEKSPRPPVARQPEKKAPGPDVQARRPEPTRTRVPKNEEAEREVVKATEEVEKELEQRKTAVKQPEDARRVIEEVLGNQSRISQAERSRDNREGNRGPDRRPEAKPRQEDVAQILSQLRGERNRDDDFRRDFDRDRDRDRDNDRDRYRDGDRDHDHYYRRPPHFHEGRRFVNYRSRQDIPAILIASSVLNRLAVQNVNEHEYYRNFDDDYYDRNPDSYRPIAPPPMEYRDDDSYVVSYAVDENTMINRDDILFRQGSTQFADDYSYDVVWAMAQAMGDSSLAGSRFVVEGHASAEGSYEANMELSQQRAERLVREMVRAGVSPDRLIPVGYGESEARYPADAREIDRQQDRRVMVFRLKE